MLVKYKYTRYLYQIVTLYPLKTMLVKYKFLNVLSKSFNLSPFKNNAC